MIENEMTVSVPLEVVKASEIEPKEVKWLWYPYIPVGKVTLLQGDPGDGKSKLTLSGKARYCPAKIPHYHFCQRMLLAYAWLLPLQTSSFQSRILEAQN